MQQGHSVRVDDPPGRVRRQNELRRHIAGKEPPRFHYPAGRRQARVCGRAGRDV